MNPQNDYIPELTRNDAELESIDLLEYVAIINRSKWSILGLTVGVSLIATVIAYAMTPIFSATATLLIESDQANVVSIEEVYGIDSSKREYYQTQFEIINSRSLAKRVIADLGISSHPEYDPELIRQSSWRSQLPFLPPLNPLTEDQKNQAIITRFINNLVVEPVRNTQLVNITFQSEDPELAQRVANALGNAYINGELDARLELTARASSWLTERLSGMRAELERSETSLRKFQEKENLVDVRGVLTLTANELDEQTKRLVDARKITAAAKSQLDAAGDIEAKYKEEWETLPSVLGDQLAQNMKREESSAITTFDELAKRYGPKHPKYIAVVSQVNSAREAYRSRVKQIVVGLNDRYIQALADQRSIEASLVDSKRQIQDINRKSYELSQLQREVDTNKQLYDMFFQRFQETNQADFAAANARFVDMASRPYAATEPRKGLIIGLAAVVGLFLGVVLAFLRSALDNTIRVAEELEQKLNLSVLGIVPFENKVLEGVNVSQLYFAPSYHSFSEAIRSLRTSVVLSGLEKSHKITVITSSVPGEGKTTVSSNLALALGQMEKVLLIDADMRRPSLAEEYGFDKSSTVGLAELVAGTSSARDCIHRLKELKIDLLTAGSVPPNPLDLLSSTRFQELLDQLSTVYDRIIIDSAPTQAVSDSMVLSTKADALIYIVKSDSTRANIAQNGIERLRRVGAPIIGAVLNQFDAQHAEKYGYYYGGSRYGYYGYGYASKTY